MGTDYFLGEDYDDTELFSFISDEWDKLKKIAIQRDLTEYLESCEDDLDAPD